MLLSSKSPYFGYTGILWNFSYFEVKFLYMKILSKIFILQNLEFDDTHVHEGKQYEYRVSAVNAAGSGPPSDVSDSIIAKQTRGKTLMVK